VGLKIPTLEEVFQRYGRRANYLIEIKNPENAPGIEDDVVKLLDRYGLRGPGVAPRQVVVQSFSAPSVRRVHALAPEVPLVQLIQGRETSESIQAQLSAIREYAVGIGPSKGSVDAALVRAAHASGLHVWPYTVNETTEMKVLLDYGADGIITNFPDRLATLGVRAGEGPRP
jgi:glycerophosphoryl diester phosphodiesterase